MIDSSNLLTCVVSIQVGYFYFDGLGYIQGEYLANYYSFNPMDC